MPNVKIDRKIVNFKVKKPPLEAPAENVKPELEHMHEDFNRPEMLLGSTYKIKTPLSDHALYITINDAILNKGTADEVRRPFEVFINSKNMEHFQWVLALTRVISAVFRKGGDVIFLVEELKAVFDPQGGYFKSGGRFMPSLVAEIGDAIESHMKMIGMIEDEELSSTQKKILKQKLEEYKEVHKDEIETSDYPVSSELCLKCHTKAVIVMDGCKTCLSCGNSKCG